MEWLLLILFLVVNIFIQLLFLVVNIFTHEYIGKSDRIESFKLDIKDVVKNNKEYNDE